MAFQSVPNCAEVGVIFVGNGITMQNSLKFHKMSGPYDQGDIDALASAIDGWAGAEYKPLVSQDISYSHVDVLGLTDENDLVGTNNTSGGAGGASVAPLPFNCTVATKFGTGLTGRSARGRAFFIGLNAPQLAASDNFISSAMQTVLLAMWTALPSYSFPADWEHVVVSRFHNGVKRTTGIFFPVTSYTLTDLRVDSQRNRLPT